MQTLIKSKRIRKKQNLDPQILIVRNANIIQSIMVLLVDMQSND